MLAQWDLHITSVDYHYLIECLTNCRYFHRHAIKMANIGIAGKWSVTAIEPFQGVQLQPSEGGSKLYCCLQARVGSVTYIYAMHLDCDFVRLRK